MACGPPLSALAGQWHQSERGSSSFSWSVISHRGHRGVVRQQGRLVTARGCSCVTVLASSLVSVDPQPCTPNLSRRRPSGAVTSGFLAISSSTLTSSPRKPRTRAADEQVDTSPPCPPGNCHSLPRIALAFLSLISLLPQTGFHDSHPGHR